MHGAAAELDVCCQEVPFIQIVKIAKMISIDQHGQLQSPEQWHFPHIYADKFYPSSKKTVHVKSTCQNTLSSRCMYHSFTGAIEYLRRMC